MSGLKEIKNKIHSVTKTRKVTRAMEAVSAVKMRKAQERARGARAYARSAVRILGQISSLKEFTTHPLIATEATGGVAAVLITSDKGLAGSLNSAALKQAEAFVQEHAGEDIAWLCMGKRGLDWAERRNYTVVHSTKNLSDDVEEADMQELTKKIVAMQESGKVHNVSIIYTNFKSTFDQEAVVRQVLPLSQESLAEVVAGILPEKGKWAEEQTVAAVGDYAIEPSGDELVREVLPRLTNIFIYHTLLENKASEHSARMIAMKNATDKAGEVAMLLKRKFNKARQAAITAEIGEITSGLEAMR
jgi:F-type H+-transporting ATPase subunit gamma